MPGALSHRRFLLGHGWVGKRGYFGSSTDFPGLFVDFNLPCFPHLTFRVLDIYLFDHSWHVVNTLPRCNQYKFKLLTFVLVARNHSLAQGGPKVSQRFN